MAQCLLDSAHNAYAIYKLLHHYDIVASIDLATRNERNRSSQSTFTFTNENISEAMIGPNMPYNGFYKDRK